MVTIELTYLIPLMILVIVGLAVWFDQLNLFIGFIGSAIAFVVSYYIAPYTDTIITPVSNSIWYGYSWGMVELLGLLDLILIFAMVIVAVNNLYLSKGKKFWG